jgi:GNAT superfamily N-acetyltransferase
MQTTKVTRADAAHVDAVAHRLALAFQADPVFRWVVPDDARRRARLPGVFGVFAAAFLPYASSVITEDGAALASPVGVQPFAGAGEAHMAALIEVLEEDAERGGQLAVLLEEHHPTEPCAHLQFMGVVAERQGRGIGSQILVDLTRRWDARGDAAYLEATSPDNRRLYERHGFVVTNEIIVPDGPTLWAMWREPRS